MFPVGRSSNFVSALGSSRVRSIERERPQIEKDLQLTLYNLQTEEEKEEKKET